MKKHKYILLISLYSCLIVFPLLGGVGVGLAQNLDSLWTVYNNKTQADTNRLKAIDALAKSYSSNEPDSAILLAEQELKLANSIHNDKAKKWVAKALNIIGIAFKNKGNYPKALEYQLKSLKLNEEIGDKKNMSACCNSIGIIYFNQANYPKALEYYLMSLKICEETVNAKGLAN